MSKIGLVVEGGGMKCAYSAGILDAFLDDGLQFDYVIGVSAGSGNAASFLAGQRDRNQRFYNLHTKDPEYFGVRPFLRSGNLFNIPYIYGTLTNEGGKDPLDYDALMANPAEFEVVATNARTGMPEYFSKKTFRRNDYTEIMASCSLPAVCKPTMVNGRPYYDGGISDAIPVERAIQKGCDKLVLLLSKPRDFIKQPENHRILYTAMLLRYPLIKQALDQRHLMYTHCQSKAYTLEKEGRAMILAPSRHMATGTYSMDTEVADAMYALGLEDYAKVREKLIEWIQS